MFFQIESELRNWLLIVLQLRVEIIPVGGFLPCIVGRWRWPPCLPTGKNEL